MLDDLLQLATIVWIVVGVSLLVVVSFNDGTRQRPLVDDDVGYNIIYSALWPVLLLVVAAHWLGKQWRLNRWGGF